MAQRILIILCIVTLLCSSGYARTTHYVTESGDGAKDGAALASAWAISDFNTAGNWGSGATQIKAGDTVYFNGNLDTRIIPLGNGESGNVITLDFTGSTFIDTTDSIKLTTYGRSYITITNWTAETGFTSTNYIIALAVSSGAISDHITVSNGVSTESHSAVINIGYSTNTVIQNNSITDLYNGAIAASDGGLYVTPLTVSGNTFSTAAAWNPTAAADIIHIGCATNVTFDGNSFTFQHSAPASGDPHSDMIQLYQCTGGDHHKPSEVVIKNNYFEISSYCDGRDSVTMIQSMEGKWEIYNNVFYSKSCSGGSALTNGMNISGHPASGGEFYIYNNTFIHKDGGPVPLLQMVPSVADNSNIYYVKNNIFYADSESAQLVALGFPNCSSATVDIDYNLWVGGDTIKWTNCANSTQQSTDSCADRKAAGAIGANNVCGTGNPFVNVASDWNLSASDTEAKDRGATLGAPYNTDKSGTSRPQGSAYDIGAYEYIVTTQYTLSITAQNCTVTSSPSGINCGATCTYDYDDGTEVTLSATCSAGYQTPVYSTNPITMTENKNETVSCSAIPVSNSGGMISGGGTVQ